MISRRVLIKQLVVTGTGLALLPSCMPGQEDASLPGRALGLNSSEESILSALCHTLIPVKEGADGKAWNAGEFVLIMVSDCQTAESQQKFVKGLRTFSEKAEKACRNPFDKAQPKEKEAFIRQLESNPATAEDNLSFFYRLTRSLTIRAYTQSEFYLTKIRPYALVPGKYQGCVKAA